MPTFLYLHCMKGGLEEARHFYGNTLALPETFSSPEGSGEGVVGFRIEDLQITIQATAQVHTAQEWAKQLGWEGGTGALPSWGIELPAADFARIVEATRSAGMRTWSDTPTWVGYWSFPVRDPMGHTVELSTPNRAGW